MTIHLRMGILAAGGFRAAVYKHGRPTTSHAMLKLEYSRSSTQLHSSRNLTFSARRARTTADRTSSTSQFKPSTSPSQSPNRFTLAFATGVRNISTSAAYNTSDNNSHSQSNMATKVTPHGAAELSSLLANRRSYYTLNSNSPLSTAQIQDIITKIVPSVPSAFNMQSCRVILCVGAAHHFVWDTTSKHLREHMGEERWAKAPTEKKLAGFRAAHGTVLFYDDTKDVQAMKDNFAAYAGKFDAWADHSQGMHQLAVWTAFEAEGLGCNLQHYNPVPDKDIAAKYGFPDTWELKAQLVFGGIDGGRPDDKAKKPIGDVFKTFDA